MFDLPLAHNGPLAWAVGLIVGMPLVLLLLTEMIVRLRRRRHSLEGSLRILRELALPIVGVYLLLTQVVQLDPTSTTVRVALTAVWIVGIHAVLALLNVVVFAGAEAGTWQAKVPTLARDLGRMLLVVVGAGIVLSTVWGTDLGALVTALGVGSLVLGLALQEPLGNLFSGILLTIERPLEVGDWVRVNDTTGRVVEINWRAVHLVVDGTQVVVVPNTVLAKGSFANLSRPTRRYSDSLVVAVDDGVPPNRVRAILLDVARGVPGLAGEPTVAVDGYGPGTIQYRIGFAAAEFPDVFPIKELLRTRVWYAAQRHALTLSPTTGPLPVPAGLPEPEREPLPDEALRLFAHLGLHRPDGVGPTLSRGAVRRYAAGERVVAKGEALPGLFLILVGRVALAAQDGGREMVRLGPGDFFGERALLTAGASDVTATALDDVELVVLSAETLRRLVEQSPRVVREIGQVMDARRRAMTDAPTTNGVGH